MIRVSLERSRIHAPGGFRHLFFNCSPVHFDPFPALGRSFGGLTPLHNPGCALSGSHGDVQGPLRSGP